MLSARRRWAALAALALISLLLLLQDTAVSVVLPAVGRDLGLSLGGLEWVINAFAVAVAALTLAAGRLADAHGRRRMFLLGIALFGAGSLLAGIAGQGWIMILARAAQGSGAAMLTSLGAAGMLVPLTGMIVVFSPLAGRMSDRIGRRPLVIGGLMTLAAALGLLSRIAVDTSLTLIVLALAITGAGIGLATPPTTAAALDGIPDTQAGQAPAVLNTSRALGLSLGIAVMGALLAASPTDVLRATATTREAFVNGLGIGLALNAGIALLAVAIALHSLPRPRRTRARQTGEGISGATAVAPARTGPG